MGKNKNNEDKFYFFRIDKDKIKVQLKNIGEKFIKPAAGRRKTLAIVITLFLLIGVGLALYINNYPANIFFESSTGEEQLETSSGEERVREERTVQETEEVQETQDTQSFELEREELSLEGEEPATGRSGEARGETERQSREEERPVETEETAVEGVVTEPVTNIEEEPERTAVPEIDLLKPVAGEVIQEAGWYFHPVFEDWRYARGIQLAGNPGDIVMAAAGGNVAEIKEDEYRGIMVKISHDNGLETVYAHLQQTPLQEGEVVGKGQEVGRIGSTGVVEEPGLYFELLHDGDALNPVEYLNR